VRHSVDDPYHDVGLDKVPRCVYADAPVAELGRVPDIDAGQDDKVARVVVVLHQLEEGLERVPRAKVVVGLNHDRDAAVAGKGDREAVSLVGILGQLRIKRAGAQDERDGDCCTGIGSSGGRGADLRTHD
jgi:hypothetical protein